MTEREQLSIGNNTLDADDEFADGYYNGTLYYYDTNRQLPRPFTSEAIHAFIQESLSYPHESAQWNAGFVFGWIAAWCENNPDDFYTSILISEDGVLITEPLPAVLQEV